MKKSFAFAFFVVLISHAILIFHSTLLNLSFGENEKKSTEMSAHYFLLREIKEEIVPSKKTINIKESRAKNADGKNGEVSNTSKVEKNISNSSKVNVDLYSENLSYDPPSAFEVIYDSVLDGEKKSTGSQSILTWKVNAEGYDATLVINLNAAQTRQIQSKGVIDGGFLIPHYYLDSYEGASLCFLVDGVEDNFNECANRYIYSGGMQDRLSMIIQTLGLSMDADNIALTDVVLNLSVLTSSGVESWDVFFDAGGGFMTEDGLLDLQKITYKLNSTNLEIVEVWVAPKLGGIPVIIKGLKVDGKAIELKIHSKKRL